jgi:hypothetical protein
MANKVLILRWAGSAYDSLGGLLELVAEELAAMGIHVTMFSADGPDWPQQLVRVLGQGETAFALTMSGIGTDLEVDGKLVWEVAKVPLFNWSCDHPCYFPSRHGIRSPYLLHGYVFPDHARYSIRHLNPNGAAFAVHLGIPPRSLFPGAPVAAGRRNGRIMFAKSGADTNRIEDTWRKYGTDLRHVVFAAAEELSARSTGDFAPVIQRIAEQRGLFLDGNNRVMLLLIRELDNYIRFRRANLVMRTASQFPVDVFGSGWDHITAKEGTATDGTATDGAARFHGPADWRSIIEHLPHYTGCLSTNPLVAESVHDRVFFALAANVPPIGDGNAFTQATMPLLDRYMFHFKPESIAEAIQAVLDDPTEALNRTEASFQALAGRWALGRSVQQIVQFAGLHPLNAPC